MPQVEYRDIVEKIHVSATMATPKKGITRLEVWFRRARKVIPDIPDIKATPWQISHQEATEAYIRFDLTNVQTQRKRYVVILRRTGGFK